jgi:hypothetical protein
MTVKRFIGTALFTWLMCWAVATGFSNGPAKLSPVVQTSPRITVQIYTPSEVQGQLYPPTTTTTTTVAPIVFAEELRDLPCAQWFNTAVDAGWPNDVKTLKTLSFIMWRESRCEPTACSTSDSGRPCADYGLIQANYAAHHKWWADMGLTPDDMFDPHTNLHWAWLLYSGREAKGQCGWQPWRLC